MRRIVKTIISSALMVAFLFLAVGGEAQASGSGVSLVANEEGHFDSIPTVYDVEVTYKNLGEYGTLNHAEDLFVDADDNLYVVDTGNNRILKLSMEGKVLAEYKEGYGVAFRSPKGVYVHTDGSIWVADSGNYRIVRLDAQGKDMEVYYKPESSLLEESFTFSPEKIYVSVTGYIYVLKGTNLMLMDSKNEFRGYVGAVAVPFNFQRFLIRTFGTKSQIERTMKVQPSAYNNFMIGSDGMVYGILANEKTGQVRKLNSVGTNTYPEQPYGFDIMLDDLTPTQAMFSDINVMDISVVSDSTGRLYVLDFSANTVTVLAPTRFIELIHEAVSLYDVGEYTASKEYWEQVLDIDSNYALAHSGYAKVLYKEDKFKEAMDQYYLGNDKEGYSKCFSEYRHQLFRQYFGWIVLAVVVGCGALWIGFKKLKGRVDDLAHRLEMGGQIE